MIVTHTSPIGLRFRNIRFSGLWLLMILVNGWLYSRVLKLWVPMLFSFTFYHLLRLIFKSITKEDPIPMFAGPSLGNLEYNQGEGRMENRTDLLFTLISLFGGLILSMVVLMKAR